MQEKESHLTNSGQKELSARELEERLYLDLGFTSFDDYYQYLKKRPPGSYKAGQLSEVSQHPQSAAPSNSSSWTVMGALDTTRETIDGLLIDSADAVIQLLLKVVPKNSIAYHFLHIVKGAAPHLVPFIWIAAGALGALVVLVLNFPLLKDKVWPQLVRAWNNFSDEIEKNGIEAALISFKNSLFQLLDQAYEHYKDRFAKAETIEEKEEILGELVAFGVIAFEGAGAVKGAGQITVKGGKALAKVPGKIPAQMTALQGHLTQQMANLSEKLGPAKMAEFLENIKKRAAALRKKSGKTGGSTLEEEAEILKALKQEGSLGAGPKILKGEMPPKTEVPVPEKTPAERARAWQGSGSYPGVDRYKNITLKEGTYILGGSPGQTEYHFPVKTIKRTGYDAQKIFEGLQVKPREELYRKGLTLYRVKTDTPAAFALTLENRHFGDGGLPQIFIPKYKEVLEPVQCFILENIQARDEILARMLELGIY